MVGQWKKVIHITGVVIILSGAALSAILTIRAGSKNTSLILPAIFLIWVLAPFVIMLLINDKLKNYPDKGRSLWYLLMMAIAIASVIAYTGILSPAAAKPAGEFLIVPLISCVLVIASAAVVKWWGRKR